MSDITGPAQAAGINPNKAIGNAAEEVDERTPETPELETPPAAPQPANSDSGGLDALKTMVEQLATTVDVLASKVASSAPDTETVKLPWPARGGKRK